MKLKNFFTIVFFITFSISLLGCNKVTNFINSKTEEALSSIGGDETKDNNIESKNNNFATQSKEKDTHSYSQNIISITTNDSYVKSLLDSVSQILDANVIFDVREIHFSTKEEWESISSSMSEQNQYVVISTFGFDKNNFVQNENLYLLNEPDFYEIDDNVLSHLYNASSGEVLNIDDWDISYLDLTVEGENEKFKSLVNIFTSIIKKENVEISEDYVIECFDKAMEDNSIKNSNLYSIDRVDKNILIFCDDLIFPLCLSNVYNDIYVCSLEDKIINQKEKYTNEVNDDLYEEEYVESTNINQLEDLGIERFDRVIIASILKNDEDFANSINQSNNIKDILFNMYPNICIDDIRIEEREYLNTNKNYFVDQVFGPILPQQ